MGILVTGSNGFIGHHTCRQLVERGEDVVGVDDLSSGLEEAQVPGGRYQVRKVQDLEFLTGLLRDFRPRAVIHLAAVARVAQSVQYPLRNVDANILGTMSVLCAVRDAGLAEHTRVVSASSSSVYGNTEVLPTPETAVCSPRSPYALAKLQAEQWCLMFHDLYGLDAVSLRYFNVYGPGARYGGAYSTVLPAWLYHLFVDKSETAFIEGDGTQSRDFSYVDDVVRANLAAADRAETFTGESVNIGGGGSQTLLEIARLLEETAGSALNLERRPPRQGDVLHTAADIVSAQRLLAWTPQVQFDEGLRQTVDWWREIRPPQLP